VDHNSNRLSNEQLNNLRTIIKTCSQTDRFEDIYLPIHAAQLEVIRVTGLWQEFEQWERELTEMAPVWDFSGYNSITSKSISDTLLG